MSSPRTWFRKSLVEPGTIVSFALPSPSRWKVLEQVSEIEYQIDERAVKDGSLPSHAAIKLLCRNTRRRNQEAFMRIYLQIPYTGTDSQSLDDLAQQSATYTPIELEALQAMTEEGSSIIPQLYAYLEGQQD